MNFCEMDWGQLVAKIDLNLFLLAELPLGFH